jgi:hypothetical protein
MAQINWMRVVLGALLAGLVIDAFEFMLNNVLLQKQWADAMRALGRSEHLGAGPMTAVRAMRFSRRHLCRLVLCRDKVTLRHRNENRCDRRFGCVVSGLPAGQCTAAHPASFPNAADANRARGRAGGCHRRDGCRAWFYRGGAALAS